MGARIEGTLISAVIGGTASVLGGGKFGNGAQTGAFGYLFNELATETTAAQRGYGRTEVYLEFKNIPTGMPWWDASDPTSYAQHAFVIVRDTISGGEWISRAGPGADLGINSALSPFGPAIAVTTENLPGSTKDYGAKVSASFLMFSTDLTGAQVAAQLNSYSRWWNWFGMNYGPLTVVGVNSNTYAFGAVNFLTGNWPRPFVVNGGAGVIRAPGSGRR